MPSFAIASAASGVIRDAHWAYSNLTLGRIRTLLLEGARTNSVTWSEDFANVSWSAPNVTVSANAITAPDGTLTADKIQETAASTSFYTSRNDTPGAATYTTSVFAKAGERTWLNLTVHQDAAYVQSYFNLATGVVGTAGAGCTLRIQAFDNGWYRCSVTRTTATTDSYAMYYIALADNDNSVFVNRLGVAGSGLYLWGAMREVGAFPSSYIATAAAGVTRNADVLTVPHTNPPGPLSFYTRFIESGSSAGKDSANRVFTIGNGSGYLTIYPDSNGIYLAEHYNGSTYSSAGPGSMVAPARGDLVELLMVVDSTGKATITQVINSGTPVSASGAANAFMAAWPSLVLTLNAASGSGAPGFIAFNAIHVEMAVLTLAEMRTLAGV